MASQTAKPLTWLITGCSSGFGLSLTLIALRAGHRVIATSRNPIRTPQLVTQVQDLGGIWLPLDINSSRKSLQNVVDNGVDHFGSIDVLVNCAGIAIIGAVEDFSSDEITSIMTTNFLGPLTLIQCILPHFRSRRSGTIVNISSGAAIDPTPGMAIYGASKGALEMLSQGLQKELAKLNIRVLIVQPGVFATGMMDAAVVTAASMTDDYAATPVGPFVRMFHSKTNGGERGFKAPNDVDKGCQGIFEVVTGTGRGEGKESLLRLLLSGDVAGRVVEQHEKAMEGRETFRDIWENTGYN